MPRTVPSLVLQNPGNIVASSLWNSGPKAVGDFYTAPPIFQGVTTSSISTASNTFTAMPINTAVVDSDSGHSNSTNNTRYTAQVAGWYLVMGYAAWTTVAGQFDVWAAVAKNGAVLAGAVQVLQKNPSDYSGLNTEVIVQLAVGDYVEVWGRQDSGGNLAIAGLFDLSASLTVVWIHS